MNIWISNQGQANRSASDTINGYTGIATIILQTAYTANSSYLRVYPIHGIVHRFHRAYSESSETVSFWWDQHSMRLSVGSALLLRTDCHSLYSYQWAQKPIVNRTCYVEKISGCLYEHKDYRLRTLYQQKLQVKCMFMVESYILLEVLDKQLVLIEIRANDFNFSVVDSRVFFPLSSGAWRWGLSCFADLELQRILLLWL